MSIKQLIFTSIFVFSVILPSVSFSRVILDKGGSTTLNVTYENSTNDSYNYALTPSNNGNVLIDNQAVVGSISPMSNKEFTITWTKPSDGGEVQFAFETAAIGSLDTDADTRECTLSLSKQITWNKRHIIGAVSWIPVGCPWLVISKQ